MNDFNIALTIDVYINNRHLILNSKALSDKTIHLIMNDIESKLNNIKDQSL